MSTHDEHATRGGPHGSHGDDPFGPHQHHWAEPLDRDESETFLDRKSNVTGLLWAFTALGAALLVADVFFHRHIYHPWEELLGFYPIWGFVGIVVLVYGAKLLRALVMRSEDYYEESTTSAAEPSPTEEEG